MRILIVEGNTGEIITRTRDAGSETAAERYRRSLALHAPQAQFGISVPFTPEMSDHDDLASYDAFALTGSGVNWSASEPEVKPYLDHLEDIFAQAKPVIGSCWGMQTVAHMFGAKTGPNGMGVEIGIAEEISLTSQGRKHYIFEGMPDSFASPCIHRDHVEEVPGGFDILAGNRISAIQAMASTRADIDYVGFQYHPEFDLDYVKGIVSRRGVSLVDPTMIASFNGKGADACENEQERTRVFANWLNHVRKTKAATKPAAA